MTRRKISVVILAAGKGTRLEPITLHHSKAMTPILGAPIAARIIEQYLRLGIDDFIVVKSPNDIELEKLCASLRKDNLSIRTAAQEKQLGTAHALLMAREYIENDFVLCSCDNLFSDIFLAELIDEFLTHKPPAVVTIEPATPEKLKKSAGVMLDGPNIIEIKEKPGCDCDDSRKWNAIAKFLFAFDKKILDYLDRIEPSPRGEFELQDALTLMMQVAGRPPRGLFAQECLHLTSAMDLIAIHRRYLEMHRPYEIHDLAKIHGSAILREHVMIEKYAEIGEGAIIGPYVYVGESARIGAKSVIENSVIYPNAVIAAGESVSGEIIVEEKKRDRPSNKKRTSHNA